MKITFEDIYRSPEVRIYIERADESLREIVANFGGETMGIGRQDDEEAKALLTVLFRGAEHKQAEEESSDEPSNDVMDEMIDEDKEVVEPPEETKYDEDLADLAESPKEYKNAKKEMKRLGFTDYDEYLDYLEYMEKRAARKKDMQM